MASITPGWAGEIWFTSFGIRMPALEGTSLDAPENFRRFGLISNAVIPVNYMTGLLYPRLHLPVLVTSNWFTNTFLENAFGFPNRPEVYVDPSAGGYYGYARANPIGDLVDIGPVVFFNGAIAYELTGIKGATFDLINKQGSTVSCFLDVWGSDINAVSWTPATLPFTDVGARSQQCSHTLPVNPLGWRLQVQNGLMANAPIPEYPPTPPARFITPLVINAGPVSVQSNMVFQAHHAADSSNFVDGNAFTFNVVPPGGDMVSFTLTNPLWQGRYSGSLGRTTDRQRWPLTAIGRGNLNGVSPLLIES